MAPHFKVEKKVFTVANKIPQDLYFPDPTLPPLPALLLSPSLYSSHGGHLSLMFSLLRPFFPQITSLLILSASSSLCSNDTFQMRPSLTLNNVVTSPPTHWLLIFSFLCFIFPIALPHFLTCHIKTSNCRAYFLLPLLLLECKFHKGGIFVSFVHCLSSVTKPIPST